MRTDRPPSLGRAPLQSKLQVVCQVCGRATTRAHARADGWLVERWRVDPALDVVRCYAHISEWSLRCSAAGRTKEWRAKLKAGRERAEREGGMRIAPHAQILTDDLVVDDDLVDYGPWWALEEDGHDDDDPPAGA